MELLRDGAFDDPSEGAWSQSSAQGLTLILPWSDPSLAEAGVFPNTLDYLARLGDADLEVSVLSQTVNVPAWAVSLTVSGEVLIQSVDDPQIEFDRAFVEIASAAPLLAWSNTTPFADWTPFSASVDASATRGQSVVFRLRAASDDGARTDFFFDTLSLTASSCPAQ